MTELGDRLARLIEESGPISVSRFMGEANAHYYATRDPLGASGDFITAPEVSQMFGELVGVWIVDLWARAGRPDAHVVELGPGRGTLAADALRAMRGSGFSPPVHFVETSPLLRTLQAARVPEAQFHDSLATIPADAPLFVIANEFFDALPIRQLVKTFSGWRERMVGLGPEGFTPTPGNLPVDEEVPEHLRGAQNGSIIEKAPVLAKLMRELARRIAAQGGAGIIVDYGYKDYAAGDTLQALSDHAYADVFARPGEQDITAHTDFSNLVKAARGGGCAALGPVGQGEWLGALGIAARAAALGRASPGRVDEIAAAHRRLTHADEMGTLFKAMAIHHREWPRPAGF